ncbi:MAG: hypothetical protein ABW204_02745 [Microbacteriaceae bacterium]
MRAGKQGERGTTGRISWVETVTWAGAVVFVAALASGVFDTMVPWR